MISLRRARSPRPTDRSRATSRTLRLPSTATPSTACWASDASPRTATLSATGPCPSFILSWHDHPDPTRNGNQQVTRPPTLSTSARVGQCMSSAGQFRAAAQRRRERRTSQPHAPAALGSPRDARCRSASWSWSPASSWANRPSNNLRAVAMNGRQASTRPPVVVTLGASNQIAPTGGSTAALESARSMFIRDAKPLAAPSRQTPAPSVSSLFCTTNHERQYAVWLAVGAHDDHDDAKGLAAVARPRPSYWFSFLLNQIAPTGSSRAALESAPSTFMRDAKPLAAPSRQTGPHSSCFLVFLYDEPNQPNFPWASPSARARLGRHETAARARHGRPAPVIRFRLVLYDHRERQCAVWLAVGAPNDHDDAKGLAAVARPRPSYRSSLPFLASRPLAATCDHRPAKSSERRPGPPNGSSHRQTTRPRSGQSPALPALSDQRGPPPQAVPAHAGARQASAASRNTGLNGTRTACAGANDCATKRCSRLAYAPR